VAVGEREARPFDGKGTPPAPATKWDEIFPAEPAFLREQHRRMVAALGRVGIMIEDVQVRAGNYYWRYKLFRGEMRATIRVSFRKNGVLTPEVLPVAGCDAALGSEALACVNLPVIAATPKSEVIGFPGNKPYLQRFYEDFILPKAEAAGAKVIRLEHHPYRERYFLARGSVHVRLDAIYKAQGTITGISRVSGDEDLGRDILDAT
jgi:hypothetical protein